MNTGKSVSRRNFLHAAVGVAGATAISSSAQSSESRKTPLLIGMCDWNLGKTANVEAIALAREIGLDGVEVSLNSSKDEVYLRRSEMQEIYRNAMYKYGIMIPSIAIGELNRVPLKSEPKTALWVADSIKVARNLGAKNILMAFFGKGELKIDKPEEIDRVVDVLKELAPDAKKAGVVLGIENTLSAEDNLKILERINSPAVQIYYDAKNSAGSKFDVIKEIKMLKGHICQAHLKNGKLHLSQKEDVDFVALAQAFKESGYDGWYVLETSSPNNLITDTKANIEFVKKYY